MSTFAAAIADSSDVSDIDLVSEVARPLTTAALAALLGFDRSQEDQLADLGPAVSEHFDPFVDLEQHGPQEAAMAELLELFAEVLYERCHQPRGDALSAIGSSFRAGRLNPAESLATATLLVVGGLDPLADLLCNGLAAAIATHPGKRCLGAETGVNVADVVEEFARFDTAVQFTARRAREDVTVSGHTIHRGEGVVVLLGSANRDERRFPNPDRLRYDRRPNPHVSFGAGRHVCLGAPFARMVARLFVEELVTREVTLWPSERSPARRDCAVPRGFVELPVRPARARR